MSDSRIGPAFLIALGLLFVAYGLDQIVKAYRPTPFDEWVGTVLPGAAALVIGALFTWDGFQLSVGTAAALLHASGAMGAPFAVH